MSMVRAAAPGRVFGSAGKSLKGAGQSWAANDDVAKVGRTGELRTGELLNQIASMPGGPTVFHDLVVPGSNANIDHVVVSGRKVTVLDSKSWRPGWYWTVAGVTFRGWRRFPFGDPAKVSLGWMNQKLSPVLPKGTVLARPALWVWPSNSRGRLVLWMLHARGTRVLPAGGVSRLGRIVGMRAADPGVETALKKLLPAASEVAFRVVTPEAPSPSFLDQGPVPDVDELGRL